MKSMKKMLCVILTFLMLMSSAALYVNGAESFISGDVDSDGQISSADARLALRASVGLEHLSFKSGVAADVNADNTISSDDARTILRVSVGLDTLKNPELPDDMPQSLQEICSFYKNCLEKGEDLNPGFTSKEVKAYETINTGSSMVDNVATSIYDSMIEENDSGEIVYEKGSADGREKLPVWKDEAFEYVLWAECLPFGDNYKIRIVMQDVKDPSEDNEVLNSFTKSFVSIDEITYALENDLTITKVLNRAGTYSVNNYEYTVEAVLTRDGQIISLEYINNYEIKIDGALVLGVINVNNKSIFGCNRESYYNFTY